MARSWTSAALRLLPSISRSRPSSSIAIRHQSTETVRTQSLLSQQAMARAPPPPPASGIGDLIHKSRIYNLSLYRSLYPMKSAPRRKMKRIHLPTHYVEVSYKLRKAVVFYQPSIAHIPHGIKDRNPVLITSGASRGQNT